MFTRPKVRSRPEKGAVHYYLMGGWTKRMVVWHCAPSPWTAAVLGSRRAGVGSSDYTIQYHMLGALCTAGRAAGRGPTGLGPHDYIRHLEWRRGYGGEGEGRGVQGLPAPHRRALGWQSSAGASPGLDGTDLLPPPTRLPRLPSTLAVWTVPPFGPIGPAVSQPHRNHLH